MLLHLPRMDGHGQENPSTTDQLSPVTVPKPTGMPSRGLCAACLATGNGHRRGTMSRDDTRRPASERHWSRDLFCDAQNPWQRGSNENTNGLLRQYFAKVMDLSQHGVEELSAVAYALNTRRRKTLGWQIRAEALVRMLKQDMIKGVAKTGGIRLATRNQRGGCNPVAVWARLMACSSPCSPDPFSRNYRCPV